VICETDEGSRSEVRGFRNFEPRNSSRAFPASLTLSLRGLRYNMPVSNHLSITPLQEESRRINLWRTAHRFWSGGGAAVEQAIALQCSAPESALSALVRCHSRVVLAAAGFAIFAHATERTLFAHSAHPWLSMYVLYLDRKAIFASREWSPWLGSMLIGLGAWVTGGQIQQPSLADQLSMMILALVVMCWGIFVSCFGITPCRKFRFGLLFLLFMIPLPTFLLDAIIGFLQRSFG